MKIRYIFKYVTLISAVFLMAGCDQLRHKIADTLSPPSPAEMALRIDGFVEKDQPAKGIEIGEDYLKSTDKPAPAVHKSLSTAYLAINDASGALKHIQRSSSESSFSESKRSQSSTSSQQVESRSSSVVSANDASVTETDKGTVVRAGDAVVIMPK